MSIVTSVNSLFTGDDYTLPRPDSSLIMESFSFEGFLYIRTPTKYLMRPHWKYLFKKISKGKYEFDLSAYRTRLNQSQAKGLLKYTQLEFDL